MYIYIQYYSVYYFIDFVSISENVATLHVGISMTSLYSCYN